MRPFTDYLSEAGVSYTIFDDPAIESLFSRKSELLNRERDSVVIGACTDDGLGVYFAQFGIRITERFLSHVVFVFNHHPRAEEARRGGRRHGAAYFTTARRRGYRRNTQTRKPLIIR
ncbi:MAG: hypothetical protein AB2L13_04700 [Spirochaetota bacterium]